MSGPTTNSNKFNVIDIYSHTTGALIRSCASDTLKILSQGDAIAPSMAGEAAAEPRTRHCFGICGNVSIFQFLTQTSEKCKIIHICIGNSEPEHLSGGGFIHIPSHMNRPTRPFAHLEIRTVEDRAHGNCARQKTTTTLNPII
jgi:hypothetical protein